MEFPCELGWVSPMFNSINATYVLIGCVILGVSAGLLGCFAFLRKRSLLGDALAHAALPGVCMAFILSGQKDPLILLAGAMVSCWLGAVSVDVLIKYTRCKEDSALAMVLSFYFGVGILLLKWIQNHGNSAQSGLDKYLFGQAASMLGPDIATLTILGTVLCLTVLAAYKEFKIVSFDPDFAYASGLPARAIEYILATLIVLAVCIGLQAVGVVLMAAMLVTPAAAARYWTDRLGRMLMLAALFGGLSGALGAVISYYGERMPTGPWMVIAVTTTFLISLLLAPKRGVLPRWYRQRRFRLRTAEENLLRTLYKFGEGAQNWAAARTLPELIQQRTGSPASFRRTLERLQRNGFITTEGPGHFRLTESGLAEAMRVTRSHRLWELYLTHQLEIAPDHVHDDAEEIEHILTPEMEAQILELLGDPKTDPHGQIIPGISAEAQNS